MTILDLLNTIEKELRLNESYLRQINKFYSTYQNHTYTNLYKWIEEAKALCGPRNETHIQDYMQKT